MALTGGIEPDEDAQDTDSKGKEPKSFGKKDLNDEQEMIERRQVNNIYRMMTQGSASEEHKKEAEPFINYAMDKYDLPREPEILESKVVTEETFDDRQNTDEDPDKQPEDDAGAVLKNL